MLGILSAIVLSTVAIGAWASADTRERNDRKDSQNKGCDFYFDKDGRMRHTGSGRRYTPEEIHQAFFPESLEEQRKRYDEKVAELKKKVFYSAQVGLRRHFFLTREDAITYIEEYNKSVANESLHMKLEDYMFSKLDIEGYTKVGDVCHFDYDKYIGVLDKPWEKNKRR